MKALGTGWAAGVGFRQIEVVRRDGGAPALALHGAARERARVLGVESIAPVDQPRRRAPPPPWWCSREQAPDENDMSAPRAALLRGPRSSRIC